MSKVEIMYSRPAVHSQTHGHRHTEMRINYIFLRWMQDFAGCALQS